MQMKEEREEKVNFDRGVMHKLNIPFENFENMIFF